ncbi:MAG TPA: amidohydrolase family protein [Burkholderiaceae bacterium]|jgi:predicted TIM-barrel fold metal-dependent hydrolase
MTRACLPPLDPAEPLSAPLPHGACDSHAHVFGPYETFPLEDDRSYTPPVNSVERYIAHLDRFGLARGVLVTASASGKDNRVVVDALQQHPQRLRGIVVASPEVGDAQLDDWHAAGVRGVRANLFRRDGHAVYRNGIGLEALEALAPRLRERGWHAQIWVHAPDLPELAPRLLDLDVPLVVDHMGRMSAARGIHDVGFQQLCRWLAEGRAWTKISGADRNTASGPPYADIDAFAGALLAANPERVVWGSDWPHINYFEQREVPDDGALLNLLERWMPDAKLRHRVLVDNPAALYDFPQETVQP